MHNDINFKMFEGQINAGELIAYYPLTDEKENFVLTKTRSQSFIIPRGWSNAGMHSVYIEGRAGYVSMEHVKVLRVSRQKHYSQDLME